MPNHPPVEIHTHPTPLTVAYKTIRETVPSLIFSDSSKDVSSHHPHAKSKPPQSRPIYDIVLHLGMAPGRDFFTLETCAHRDGYRRKDALGELLEGDYWKQKYDAPKILHTGFDTKDVLKRWKSGLEVSHSIPLFSFQLSMMLTTNLIPPQSEDLRSSTDPGYYLCDYIYYTSLFEYWHRDPNGPRPVMFLHVPGGFEEEDIERGREATLGLISALVESRGWR